MTDSTSIQAAETARSAFQRLNPLVRLGVKLGLFVLVISAGFGSLYLAHSFRLIGRSTDVHSHAEGEVSSWICPMMCVPPQSEPGRCPVCGMELVPAASGGGPSDSQSIQLDPAARRIAHIETAVAESLDLTRTIRSIGKIGYDEANMRSIAAYVDGRIETLYADFTGVEVAQGDKLAYLYSPRLYTAQVELLEAKRGMQAGGSEFLAETNRDLYASSRTLLVELGMTPAQIDTMEQDGEASSRLHINSPISGTVIAKRKVEGQYVKEGEVIYELADLSNVWLMLELFPEDAAAIRVGQTVSADVQSLPGRSFEGQVEFVDPMVDEKTRTVSVRVEIANPNGALRIGDFATAKIDVLLGSLMPQDMTESEAVIVPRSAVLMAGDNSVAYVETEPGRFEIRRVMLGPQLDGRIVVSKGIAAGESVATRGNFLIDSQMQLAGNPSLIDPSRAIPKMLDPFDVELSDEMIANLDKLSHDDRALADKQVICPVTEEPLGSMGVPPKIIVDGRSVLLCCAGCEGPLRDKPAKYFANLERSTAVDQVPEPSEDPEIAAALAELSPADAALAREQVICPVADFPLGSMGPPEKIDVNGQPVFICCEGCRESLLEDPAKYLKKIKEAKTARATSGETIQ